MCLYVHARPSCDTASLNYLLMYCKSVQDKSSCMLNFSKISGSQCTDTENAMPEPPGAMHGTWTPCCHIEETATCWKDSRTWVTRSLHWMLRCAYLTKSGWFSRCCQLSLVLHRWCYPWEKTMQGRAHWDLQWVLKMLVCMLQPECFQEVVGGLWKIPLLFSIFYSK